jgi:hypothetical protein
MAISTSLTNRRLLHGAMVLLILLNLVYWPAKLLPSTPGWIKAIYEAIKGDWGTFLILEFMLVASIFADLIIRFDAIDRKKRLGHLLIVALCSCAFVLRFLIGVMEKYITGVLQ